MDDKENFKPPVFFKGAGILLGFILGSAAGIVTVAITGIMGLIGAVAASVALPLGLYFERKFQRMKDHHQIIGRKRYLLFVLLGAVMFFICFILVK